MGVDAEITMARIDVLPPRSTQFQACAADAQHLLQNFAERLERVQNLSDFVNLLSEQSPGFFGWLHDHSPDVFEKTKPGNGIADKFKRVLREANEEETFTRLMDALPVFPVPAEPAPGPTKDVFDVVKMETREDCYRDIFGKWLAVWPVHSRVLPNQFALWLSGNMHGSTTPDLKEYRERALNEIYDQWLEEGKGTAARAHDRHRSVQKLMEEVHSYDTFVVLVQLVPIEFWYWQDPEPWYWQDPKRAGGPRALSPEQVRQFIDKRQRVWRKIHQVWQRV